ncbi:Pimeloyl-ACP methyl ester carboxylesterase [Granulicella pectinivorans]|uniref:Pimeloyl-ACP methyl ester carboxylesterase n=1 Tax=Granulicella pectinivorans TaxID=474950 RepID=A0A1I6LXZ5_9BACT|nr:alpha/beta hydrolase [Granulicella pectinivorans]SFS08162.1 Pimeloyl-ACP methyl ester carboxylesterase [Granulicella pectinivorans]
MKSFARAALAAAITLFNHGGNLMAQSTPAPIKNVVLIHGAFADGSSWSKVIPLLQAKGLHVVSVQIPLTSFDDDVAATKRVIEAQDGPVLLVGHSYGGVVISEAGNEPKVAGLVYVAAFAPDSGENIVEISKSFPKPPGMDTLAPQADGFLLLTPQGVKENFAQDLTESEKNILVAVQPYTAGAIFGAKVTKAAWHDKPTSYIVSSNDRMISPEQEKSMAKQMNAATTVLPASHVVMLSHPKEVAAVIEKAITLSK